MFEWFDDKQCVICYHTNHPGFMCTEPIPKELFEPGEVSPYLATCACRWPTSEAERGERIVTLGHCSACGHQNHTGYGECWYQDVEVEMGTNRLVYIPCLCIQ